MTSDSIHVPSAQAKRLKALAKFVLPIIGIAAGTAWTTTATWIRTRPSSDDVAKTTAECTTLAKDAQDQGKTHHAQIYALQDAALQLARITIGLHAQAEVERAYSGSKRLPEYIDRARKFYTAEFERELDEHPGELVRAVRQAQRVVWRPDRD
jgi:hypothetical protein